MPHQTQQWLERINHLYTDIKQSPQPTFTQARHILFDATSRTSTKERTLLAMIDHPAPEITVLLEHPALSFQHPRLHFTHQLAIRRRHRKQHPTPHQRAA